MWIGEGSGRDGELGDKLIASSCRVGSFGISGAIVGYSGIAILENSNLLLTLFLLPFTPSGGLLMTFVLGFVVLEVEGKKE
jgi:hypothetical protein